MRISKRTKIVVVIGLVLVMASLFVTISIYRGVRICGHCQTRQAFQETSYFVLGASWDRIKADKLKPSQFLVDFPEHHCEHFWTGYEGEEEIIWGPIFRRDSKQDLYTNCSRIIARYSEDANFRKGLKQLLADGVLSRERLLEIAKISCMDGGICQLKRSDPGEAALLDLINAQEAAPAGEGEAGK